MLKNDAIKDIVSEIGEEVVKVQREIDELEKRRERVRHKRILNGIKHGVNDNISNI